MYSLSKQIKLEVLRALIPKENAFSDFVDRQCLIDFLNDLFDLRALPSEDKRFTNAYDDIHKHFIMNDDWDYEYIFIERFNVIDDTEIFTKFIHKIVSPSVRANEEEISEFVQFISTSLEKEKLTLRIAKYADSGLPIYEMTELVPDMQPIDVEVNKIPFVVVDNPSARSHLFSSHPPPSKYPVFILVKNTGWNDYGICSSYDLFFYEDETCKSYVGFLKIIYKSCENTSEALNGQFFSLDNGYCSLGQSYSYYSKLREIFPQQYRSILWSLKDAAFFSDVYENFNTEYNFKKSLIREDDVERLRREVKPRLYGHDMNNLYDFQYEFSPKYADEATKIDFNFDNNGFIPRRIIALIGKNGTGKTQLVTSLPLDISRNELIKFHPKIPLFGKVIAVSYSVFDNFTVPKKNSEFNYIYCGLRKTDDILLSSEELKARFHGSWKNIKEQERFQDWVEILSDFLEQDIIDSFIVVDDTDEKVDIGAFNKNVNNFSSGQLILLYIITEIVSEIRYDSLIIYDEPELHLHPNAISQLINTIHRLVDKFQSYCIIATHSPLIVREIFSKSVYVVERENNCFSIRKPSVETFGENLTILTDEVFGNRAIPSHFKRIIDRLVQRKKTYAEIINYFELNDIALNFNVKIYLKSIVND